MDTPEHVLRYIDIRVKLVRRLSDVGKRLDIRDICICRNKEAMDIFNEEIIELEKLWEIDQLYRV